LVDDEDIELNFRNYIIDHDLLTKRISGGGGRMPIFNHPMIINFFKGYKRSPKEIESIKSMVNTWFAANRKKELVKELGLCDLSDEGLKIEDNKKQLEIKTKNVLELDKYKDIEFQSILKSSRGVMPKTALEGTMKYEKDNGDWPENTLLLVIFDLVGEYEIFVNPPKPEEKGKSQKGNKDHLNRIIKGVSGVTNLYIEPLDPRVEEK